MEINVHPHVNTTAYRHKMPEIETRIEGGSLTKLVNVRAVAKALNRKKEHIVKFLGCVLGVGVCAQNNLIGGSVSRMKVQELIDVYIANFVLCDRCTSPETVLLSGSGNPVLRCGACGYIGRVLGEEEMIKDMVDDEW
ncbi:putative eukaryotic translation initiation factor [Abalone herpesvirus Victoria/AUS/2009]|uniref:Putative eukaryotic translation initiation factor n=1 Tax=Abalone herpesvirus (isolate Abalone/Australia/Victoria/2009) TaxID=1241371 RepID=K4JYD8_ABHV|nr:putative eukaryotic translation initiation factor [Abalone herpesvirus Victoria/AUS/2009]AFU90013.1 putative eukaryotic translation initiation factor [Abalone herpesvirus Victoria/AUS/2009]